MGRPRKRRKVKNASDYTIVKASPNDYCHICKTKFFKACQSPREYHKFCFTLRYEPGILVCWGCREKTRLRINSALALITLIRDLSVIPV